MIHGTESQPPEPGRTTHGGFVLALDDIRRRRRMAWTVFLLYLPVVVIFVLVFGEAFEPYVILIGMGLFAFTGLRVWWVKCPRCGDKFHATTWYHNIWTSECLHCHLPLDPPGTRVYGPEP
jgi:hypothetical protein